MGHENKWAVVLCGGRGTRLGKYTKNTPKSLVPINGKPILDYIFKVLNCHGYNRIILPTGYLTHHISDFVRQYQFQNDVECFVVDTGVDTPIGARIDCIKNIIACDNEFLLLNGDLIFDFDLNTFRDRHKKQKWSATFASAAICSPFGLLHCQDGKLIGFTRDEVVRSFNPERGGEKGFVYSGICMMNRSVLEDFDISKCCNFEAEIFPKIIESGKAGHFQIDGLWHPVDTPKDIISVESLLQGERVCNE